MRALETGELAAWLGDGARQYRVRARRPEEVSWTNLSDVMGGDWVLGITAQMDTPDQPAGSFTLRFLKHESSASLSPGISLSDLNRDGVLDYRPLLHPGRSVEVDARVDAHPWRLWLQGQIEDVQWEGYEVVASCLTLDAAVLSTQIEVEQVVVAEDDTLPLADFIQAMLDLWMTDSATPAPTLVTVGDPEWEVGRRVPERGSLGEYLRAEAQRPAWDLRYRWNETAGDYRYTLYLPPRDATTPTLTLSADQVFEVPGLRQSRDNVRNAVVIRHATGSEIQVDGESIAEYGRRAMPIDEPELTAPQAVALATAALSDTAWPLADGRWRIPLLPWLELHDLIEIEADGDHYDFDTSWAVVGGSHVVDPDGGAWTVPEVRGGAPVGMYYGWRVREGFSFGGDITDQKVTRTETTVTLSGRLGTRATEVWAYEAVVSVPFDEADWPDITGTPTATYSAATFLASGHTALIPDDGYVRPVVLVSKDPGGLSLYRWPYLVYPIRPAPSIVDVVVTGQRIQVTGGPGVRSIRIAQRGGDWDAFYDGAGLNLLVSDADTDGDPGISGTEVWTLDVEAYGAPKSEVTVGVTYAAERSTTVYGPGVADPTAEPRLGLVDALAPSLASTVMSIRVRGENITAETIKVYYDFDFGVGWQGETEITGDTTPAAGAAPTVTTTYTFDTETFTRTTDASASVQVKIRVELLSGATVVDSDWDIVTWFVG